MQDAARTSEAAPVVNGVDHRDARPPAAAQCNTSVDSGRTKTRGKKRVRRIQLELPFFRSQVRDLEHRLKRLKLRRSLPASAVKRSVQNLVQIEYRTDQTSAWNGIAERQLKERLRAEQQQQQLKETHVELLDMSVELHKLLRKCDNHKQEVEERLVQAKQQRYWDLKKDPEDEIYADQLSIVTRMRLEMQILSPTPCRALTLGSGLSMGQEMVRWDPSVKAGFVLEMQCGTVLPFTLDVAAEAYWRFFGRGHGLERVAGNDSEFSTNTVAHSFKIRADSRFRLRIGGTYTARRYMDADGVTIVFAGTGDVEQFDGVKFSGTQMHKRGCLKLRRAPRQGPGQQSTSTVVEASFETLPVFHDSVVNKAQQTQALLDAFNSSYSKLDNFFCQRMGSLLVEEDWKATFGRD